MFMPSLQASFGSGTVVALVVGQMELEDMDVLVDELGQADVPGHQVNGADAARSQGASPYLVLPVSGPCYG